MRRLLVHLGLTFSLTLSQAHAAPAATCFATPDDGTTVFSDTTAQAVRQAVTAAAEAATVKIAGNCAGVVTVGGSTQVAVITQTLTLAGGYSPVDWAAPDPLANPTTLDAQNFGRVLSATAPLTLTNLIVRNGVDAGQGGGAYFANAAFISNTLFISNSATYGGGAYFAQAATLTGTTFTSNTTSFSGGGAYFNSVAVITGSTFATNTTTLYGGGAYFNNSPTSIVGAVFQNNRSQQDGGGAYFISSPVTMTATSFRNNLAASGTGGGALFWEQAQVVNTTFSHNTASLLGGGAWFNTANLTNTAFVHNSAGSLGGGARFFSTTHVLSSTFTDNVGGNLGGGAAFSGLSYLTATTFIHNRANNGSGLHLSGASAKQLVNTLFARNEVTNGATLLVNDAGPLHLIHATIVSPTLANAVALQVTAGTAYLTNTLIANYAVGLAQSGGSLYENFNLFANVTTPYSGSVLSGGSSITGSAVFMDAALDNYRLGPLSAAINMGTDAGITTDLDGIARPQNGGYDIGAYEAYWRLYLLPIRK